MDTLEDFLMSRPPTANRPLLGLTILAVEDSRYACEALRLLCIKSGARIRRADSLDHARRHLRVYRPNVLIVDLGLPDGSGTELISEAASGSPRADVILGTSGDPGAADRALRAGADGFLDKPVGSLGHFQSVILDHLPPERRPAGLRPLSGETVDPDPLALRDDYAHARALLPDPGDEASVAYAIQFLGGLAQSTSDRKLASAIEAVAFNMSFGAGIGEELDTVREILDGRLAAAAAF